jgi:hypothetical protein
VDNVKDLVSQVLIALVVYHRREQQEALLYCVTIRLLYGDAIEGVGAAGPLAQAVKPLEQEASCALNTPTLLRRVLYVEGRAAVLDDFSNRIESTRLI